MQTNTIIFKADFFCSIRQKYNSKIVNNSKTFSKDGTQYYTQ